MVIIGFGGVIVAPFSEGETAEIVWVGLTGVVRVIVLVVIVLVVVILVINGAAATHWGWLA